ncbi:MAG: SIR2 family protein, partial [Actinomycetota bacterium]|nr:SIR2 family protein [Actinomycetota bacterium]
RKAWVDQVLGGESPLGAAAVADALAGDALAEWIPDALYGEDPGRFQPGPIARQVPVLREAFGAGLRVVTTNYDDLLQQAFEDAGIGVAAAAFTGPAGPSVPPTDDANQRISHLHGFLARDGTREGTVVLTEDDYQRVAQTDWQGSEVGAALMGGPCVFIGSSLTDPNLLRYLHVHTGPGSPRHFAIFTRQDAYPKGTPPEVIVAREEALTARWRSNNLEIVFVDHYAEIAVALAEVARGKREGGDRPAAAAPRCLASAGHRTAAPAAGRGGLRRGAGPAPRDPPNRARRRRGDRDEPRLRPGRRGPRGHVVARRRCRRHAHELGDDGPRPS